MKKKYTVFNQYLITDYCVVEANSHTDALERSDDVTQRLTTLEKQTTADMYLVTPCDIRDRGKLADCPELKIYDAIENQWQPVKLTSQELGLTDLDAWIPQRGKIH